MRHRINLQAVPRDLAPMLRQAARRTLALAGAPDGELTVRLTGTDEIQRLHREFAQDDTPTDVLSFPSGEAAAGAAGIYFGDIAIALPIASAHANAAGHDLRSELILLAVHGVLHLLGHHHADADSRHAMWTVQDRILADLGLSLRSPQEAA